MLNSTGTAYAQGGAGIPKRYAYLFAGMASVAFVEATMEISFLWNNVVGTVAVVVVGMAISLMQPLRLQAR